MEKKKIYVYLAAAVLIAGGYFSYTLFQEKQAADAVLDEQVSDFEDKIASQCENGEWIKFPVAENPDRSEKFSGNAKLAYSDDGDAVTDEDGAHIFVTTEGYSLDYFVGRETRLEGAATGRENGEEIHVDRIKCVGKEADIDIREMRRRVMNHIGGSINSLAVEKSPKNDWQVQAFYFVNDTDLYVEYESLGSLGGDTPYDARLWLVRVSKTDRSVPVIETLAYIEEDEEDPEQNVTVSGEDLYKDTDNMLVYEYDEDLKQWVLQ